MKGYKFKIGDEVRIVNSDRFDGTEKFIVQSHFDAAKVFYWVQCGIDNVLVAESKLELYNQSDKSVPEETDVPWSVSCNQVLKELYEEDLQELSKQFAMTCPSSGVILSDTEDDPMKHQDHEIIDNIVLGKTFKYCRTCKEEV